MISARYATLTKEEIAIVSLATVTSLKACGFRACLVGGAACMTYGLTRVPNDIDIVVLNSGLAAEEIKKQLVSANPSFFLVPSTNPRNTYKVLWYNLRGSSLYLRPEHACKVDILIPGIMNIPAVPNRYVVYSSIERGTVPVMPFIAVLLLKLQAWEDHQYSYRADLRNKQYVDVDDINELLKIAARNNEMHVQNENWLSESFVTTGKLRVLKFTRTCPASAAYWRQIGLADR